MPALCLPGWSCEKLLPSWRGMEAAVIPHSEQMRFFLNQHQAPSWLPKNSYTLVTWSMGTWTALKLSHLWGTNPPKAWIALAPFRDLCRDHGAITPIRALEKLRSAYKSDPLDTIHKFSRLHGGQTPWCPSTSEESLGLFAQSLASLCEPCPWDIAPSALSIPIQVEFSPKDRLVSPSMAHHFAKSFEHVQSIEHPHLRHNLFYENDQALTS